MKIPKVRIPRISKKVFYGIGTLALLYFLSGFIPEKAPPAFTKIPAQPIEKEIITKKELPQEKPASKEKPPQKIESLPTPETKKIDVLVRALSSGDEKEILEAIPEAIKMGSDALFRNLESLARNQDPVIRVTLAKSLASAPESQRILVELLLAELLSDSDYLVRGFAGRSLSALGGATAKQLIEERLSVEENETIQKVLKAALAQAN